MSYNSNSNYQGQGYPPQQNQGYPPQQGQGYPPKQGQGYPPQQGQAYPPQQSQGYPPQQGQGYPPQQGQGYPPQQGQGYPPQQGQGYPPQQGQGYPPKQGQGYPPQQGQGYPPQQGQGYPPQQGQGYPPQQGQGYPPQQGQGYLPQQGQGYPPQQKPTSQTSQGYPHQQSQGYPAQQKPSSGYPPSSQGTPNQTSSIPPGDPKKLGRPHPSLRWVKTTGKTMPQDAVQGGFEQDGKPLFIARAFYKGSLVVGKAGPHIGCLIPYDTKERSVDEYYVLCGSANELRWRECSGRLKVEGWAPLEAGNEADGTELFVAKTKFKGGEPVGKVGVHMAGGICFGYDCKEVFIKSHEVYYVLSHP